MSHQEKQRIFDEYAKSVCEEYNNWIDLCMDHFETSYPKYMDVEQFFSSLMFHVNNACDLVQAEQQKRIAENAELKEMQYHIGTVYEVDKSSILNPENKIH